MLNARRFALLLILVAFAAPAIAGENVVVRTSNGREFRGEVHDRSTKAVLWLESQGASAKILRPIPWAAVDSVFDSRGRKIDAESRLSQLVAAPSKPQRKLIPADTAISYAKQALRLLGFTD